MNLKNLRIWVQLLLTVALALLLVWAAVIAWESRANREAAIEQATAFSTSMHEATMAGLTAMMVTGTVGQRAVFLDQVRQLDSIRDLRVLRGDAVTQAFGAGSAAEQAAPTTSSARCWPAAAAWCAWKATAAARCCAWCGPRWRRPTTWARTA